MRRKERNGQEGRGRDSKEIREGKNKKREEN